MYFDDPIKGSGDLAKSSDGANNFKQSRQK